MNPLTSELEPEGLAEVWARSALGLTFSSPLFHAASRRGAVSYRGVNTPKSILQDCCTLVGPTDPDWSTVSPAEILL